MPVQKLVRASDMILDTKMAFLLLDNLAAWQKLTVTAFRARGIAAAPPDAMGEPYEDGFGCQHARLLGQPVLMLAASLEVFRAHTNRPSRVI